MKKRKVKIVRSRVDIVDQEILKATPLEKAERLALARAIIRKLDERAREARVRTIKKIKMEIP